MSLIVRWRIWLGLLSVIALSWCATSSAIGQDAAAKPTAPPTGYRRLAPGVETTIPANPDAEDTVSKHDFTEILKALPEKSWTPKLGSPSQTLKEMATNVSFRRDVWYLDFSFKPLRTIFVDVPRTDGTLEHKLVWYLIYRVQNKGKHLHPGQDKDGNPTVQYDDQIPVRWFPEFTLESTQFGWQNKEQIVPMAIADQVMPLAMDAIRAKEDPNRKFLNSVEMSSEVVALSTENTDRSVWGIATWQGVDPRVDYFTVSVKGLTNAYKWVDTAGGRLFGYKTLQLNFWRPGDEFHPGEQEIYYGIPGQVDSRWLFRQDPVLMTKGAELRPIRKVDGRWTFE